MSIFQYIKDTQGELRHVAWPTRMQTTVYTILVAAVSIIVALYLGLFDFIFTSTLSRTLGVAPVESNVVLPDNGTSSIQIETSPEIQTIELGPSVDSESAE